MTTELSKVASVAFAGREPESNARAKVERQLSKMNGGDGRDELREHVVVAESGATSAKME